MANNVQDTLRELLISTIEGAGKNVNGGGDKMPSPKRKGGSGARGLAAGVGAAALAPAAVKGLSGLARKAGMEGVQDLVKSPGKAVQGLGSTLGGQVGSNLGDKVSEKVDDAGGPGGLLADTVKDVLPFGGGGGGTKGGGLGVGKGRRMPVQQSIDIGAPIETVYNQWTQFEDWPTFMHRVVRVTQDDDCTVTFEVKIWTRTREFTAKIETQRPDDRIKWKVSQGMTHAGVVTFHELGPKLTRVLLSIDVQPGGLIEKMARGMRHVKRAARGDLHRFKAFVEMAEQESGAWRGVIEDGEVVEEHDPSYDKDREYSDPEAVMEELEDAEGSADEDEDEEHDDAASEDEEEDEEQPKAASTRRRRRQSANGGSAHDDDDAGQGSTRSRSRGRSSASGASSRASSSRGSSSRGSSSRGSSSRGGSSRSASSRGSSRSSGSGSGSGSGSTSSRRASGNSRSSGGSSRSSGGSSSSRRSRSSSSNN